MSRQRGFAMVEFVIAAPVLLLLMCGTVEFGQYLIQYSTLNDSVRNAARYVSGAVLDSTGALLRTGGAWGTLVTQGQNLAVHGNIAGTGAALLPGLTTAQITVTENTATDNITVTAAYPYQSVFGVRMPTFLGGNIATNYTLTISTTMRAL
ncbi:MAG TPA: TadE/TadG family type IV pilus assembly protein [Steroidobacteraceae bacterium]|jgi:Flp pilus assembly protein TadG